MAVTFLLFIVFQSHQIQHVALLYRILALQRHKEKLMNKFNKPQSVGLNIYTQVSEIGSVFTAALKLCCTLWGCSLLKSRTPFFSN